MGATDSTAAKKQLAKKKKPAKLSSKLSIPKADTTYYYNLSKNANMNAALSMIRHGEGTDDDSGWYKRFTGEKLTTLDSIPAYKVITSINSKGDTLESSAVTAYQYLHSPTHRYLEEHLNYFGFKDILPAHQNMMAIHSIEQKNAIQDIIDGNIISFIGKTNRIWASLPGSPYKQRTQDTGAALQYYQQHGGVLDSTNQSIMTLALERKKARQEQKKQSKGNKKSATPQKKPAKSAPATGTDGAQMQINTMPVENAGNYSLPNTLVPEYSYPHRTTDTLKTPEGIQIITTDYKGLMDPKNMKDGVYYINGIPDSVKNANPMAPPFPGMKINKPKPNPQDKFNIPFIYPLQETGGIGLNNVHKNIEDTFNGSNSLIQPFPEPQEINISQKTDANTSTGDGRSVTVNLNTPMIGNFSISTNDGAGLGDLKRQVEEVLFEVINSANTA